MLTLFKTNGRMDWVVYTHKIQDLFLRRAFAKQMYGYSPVSNIQALKKVGE